MQSIGQTCTGDRQNQAGATGSFSYFCPPKESQQAFPQMDLKSKINLEKLPRHIAVIMDGNGRWAKEHGMPRVFGHRNGVKAVREVTEACTELGVEYLTLGCGLSAVEGRVPRWILTREARIDLPCHIRFGDLSSQERIGRENSACVVLEICLSIVVVICG
jgi:hypothetical protein